MFDSVSTRCLTPKSVVWDTPTSVTLDLGDENGAQTYILKKGALEYLHSKIEVKVPTSKELYKKSPEVWKEFRDKQLQEVKDKMITADVFDLESPTMIYLLSDGGRDIIDIIDMHNKEDYENFKLKHQEFNLDITTMETTRKIFAEGKSGLVKFICYDKDVDITKVDYTPIVILELNGVKSKYQAYNGILLCDVLEEESNTVYTIMPSLSANLDEKYLSTFIEYFDMKKALDFAKEQASDLYNAYLEFKKDPIEISAREMTSLCKNLGYKLELDDGNTLHPVENIADDNNNIKIQQFYNTFKDVTGESTYEILQMSDLKRTFRYNKLTLLEVLTILSKEYLAYSGSKVTAELLSDIVYKLYYSKNVDKIQSEDVKNDMK